MADPPGLHPNPSPKDTAGRASTGRAHSQVLPDAPYEAALDFLAGFVDVERGGVPASVFALDRIREILTALGDPQRRYPSVLIAGTNGKGSTAAMVECALRAAGYRTGLYTQPHLHTIRERVRIDGEPASRAAFARAMAPVRSVIEQTGQTGRPGTLTTAYEVVTALALEAFTQQAVDVAVLEVGLGGRLDATNVVEAVVAAITPIALDHTQVLGDTLAAIAAEKADIIKPGRPCVTAPQSPEVIEVISVTASARGAPLRLVGENGARWAIASSWDLLTKNGRISDLRPALLGHHQRTNVAVAATILDALSSTGLDRIDPQAIRAGIEQVSWPGRFEVLSSHPTVVVDGAHNVAAAVALRQTLDLVYPGTRCVFVIGIASDKDVAGILHALRGSGPRADQDLLVATRSGHPRAAPAEGIATEARAAGFRAVVAPTVKEALAAARAAADDGDIVVAAGSLYVAAEAREALGLDPHADEPGFDPWAAGPAASR